VDGLALEDYRYLRRALALAHEDAERRVLERKLARC
jgi:hypothetical protein